MAYTEKALEIKKVLDLGYAAEAVGITMEEKPTKAPSKGHKWEMYLNGTVISWHEVKE